MNPILKKLMIECRLRLRDLENLRAANSSRALSIAVTSYENAGLLLEEIAERLALARRRRDPEDEGDDAKENLGPVPPSPLQALDPADAHKLVAAMALADISNFESASTELWFDRRPAIQGLFWSAHAQVVIGARWTQRVSFPAPAAAPVG